MPRLQHRCGLSRISISEIIFAAAWSFALRKRWLSHLLSIRLITPTVAPWQPVVGKLNLLRELYVSRVPTSCRSSHAVGVWEFELDRDHSLCPRTVRNCTIGVHKPNARTALQDTKSPPAHQRRKHHADPDRKRDDRDEWLKYVCTVDHPDSESSQ